MCIASGEPTPVLRVSRDGPTVRNHAVAALTVGPAHAG